MALEAIRDEIRESKRFTSMRWKNSDAKNAAVLFIDESMKKGSAVSQLAAVAAHLKAGNLTTEEDIRDLETLSRNGEQSNQTLLVKLLRRNNATTQMHELFYEHNKDVVD